MNTLRGRPINLKATMTEAEMLAQIKENEKNWLAEGFSLAEIKNAMAAKMRPLAVGFYWHRYPEAQERINRVAEKYLGYSWKNAFKTSHPKIKRGEWIGSLMRTKKYQRAEELGIRYKLENLYK